MAKYICPTCNEPMECANCYRREISARGGRSVTPKRLKHLKAMTKARVKAQKERKQAEEK